jgi:LVIVD repeat
VRRALAILVVVLAFPSAASAAPEASRGVRLAASIPERGVVSARAVGNHLYVSSLSGVTVFDISNPRAPARVGRLDLPNAQNEDVDAGSGILLVSDDPFGGRGILHVIDIRDPANPRLLSTYSTWARGLYDFFDPPRRGGIGHTASCIQRCRFAWLAGSAAGIDIVDLRDPARPRLLRRFGAREAAGDFGTHDVQVDSRGLAWVTGGAGTAAYHTSNPRRPRLVFRTDRRGSRGPLNNFIHHNALRLRRNVVAVTEEDFGDRCRRAGSLQTWKIVRGRRRMRPLDSFSVERDAAVRVMCSAHYFDARRGLIAQGFYEQGVRLVDARRPGRLRQVGYYLSRPGLVWGAIFAPTDRSGSTIYALDHSRGIDVLAIDRSRLRPVRRRGARRSVTPKPGFGLAISDGFEAVRPGQNLRIGFGVFGRGRGVSVEATLPPELVDVQVPAGVAYDPATRTLRYTVARLRGAATRIVRARVAPTAALQTPLEVIGYASGPDDPLPLDDRGVDRGIVARRAESSNDFAAAAGVGTRRLFCVLPR